MLPVSYAIGTTTEVIDNQSALLKSSMNRNEVSSIQHLFHTQNQQRQPVNGADGGLSSLWEVRDRSCMDTVPLVISIPIDQCRQFFTFIDRALVAECINRHAVLT
jgi:hypothetical protein